MQKISKKKNKAKQPAGKMSFRRRGLTYHIGDCVQLRRSLFSARHKRCARCKYDEYTLERISAFGLVGKLRCDKCGKPHKYVPTFLIRKV